MRVRGKESGADTTSPLGYVVDFQDGKMICVRTYLDPDRAIEAAGMTT